MKKIIKVVAVFLLMLCFGMSSVSCFFFDVAQVNFKLDAADHVQSGRGLETIKLSEAEFKANRSDDEVWVNGKLYDISSYTVENGVAYVTVYHDADEEIAVKNIAAAFDHPDGAGKSNLAHMVKHRASMPDGKVLPQPFTLMISVQHSSCSYFLADNAAFSQNNISVVTPPPDKVFNWS